MDPDDLPDAALLLENQLCFSLYAASRKVIQLYTPYLTRLDLTYTQYITLLALWEDPIQPVKDLGERLLLDSGTLTPLLKKMEKKGLVTRRRSSDDERSVLVELTEKGRALKQEARSFLSALQDTFRLSPDELVETREMVKKLLDNIR